MQNRKLSILCAAGRSHYVHMPNTQVFTARNDARSFGANTPAVAHPPCRCWSKNLSGQAKPPDRKAEMELGLWCVETVIKCGGVLEHPAGSRLWTAANLPLPNAPADPFLFTLYVEQGWFGFPTPKPTWILVAGVPKHLVPPVPFAWRQSKVPFSSLASAERSRTTPELANWLCQTARATWWRPEAL